MGGESEDACALGVTQRFETVTGDARRRVLEAMAYGSAPRHPELELLVLGPLGLATVEPIGERFPGEAEAIARITSDESQGRDRATQRLAEAAIEIWRGAREGTAASRTSLLRATLAFLLHYAASETALRSDEEASASPAGHCADDDSTPEEEDE